MPFYLTYYLGIGGLATGAIGMLLGLLFGAGVGFLLLVVGTFFTCLIGMILGAILGFFYGFFNVWNAELPPALEPPSMEEIKSRAEINPFEEPPCSATCLTFT